MKWGARTFLKGFFTIMTVARRSTSSNVEALRLVVEQDFIPIVGRDYDGIFLVY
jgi:hypothetical protein